MANIVNAEQASVSKIEEQFDLLKLFGLPETSSERYYVRTDMVADDDGVEKPKYTLCKRENPVSIFYDDDNNICVSRVVKTYTERVGGLEIKVDGLRPEVAKSVINNVLCQSIDVGDTDPFASI